MGGPSLTNFQKSRTYYSGMKLVVVPFLLAASLTALPAVEPLEKRIPKEVPNQPPGRPARSDSGARTPGQRVAFGSFTSVQVNVDAGGNNIVGDAANEPSLAVNPLNPANMVVGWRQFDTVLSDFRQAGWAYTFDGGGSWTFPGVLTPGTFRSDPVLDVSANGTFYYQSLKGNLRLDMFQSTNGGISWSGPVPQFGGDKNWLAVDRSGGPGHGFLYGIWQRFGGACCGTSVFTRSTDTGASYETPVPVALWPTFGTLTVGPSGEVYAAGIDGTVGQDVSHFVVSKSIDAENGLEVPTFNGGQVNLGGSMEVGSGPNPVGLLGQANVFVNPSVERRGEVYLLASVAGAGTDPLDVHLVRSADGGATWSAPVKVNNDLGANWQWMAAASVAPNGRIDTIWYDTRGSGLQNIAQLFYAYSWDGGQTWFENVAVTPSFNTSLGYPQQGKMGDYIQIVSGEVAANAAYTATFNSEQDVYHIRVFPDCNGNGVSDVTDIQAGAPDCNATSIPDVCEGFPACLGAGTIPASGAASLLVAEGSGGSLLLRWGPSCQADDNDYAVYEGTLGTPGSHTARFCTTGGSRLKVLTPAAGNTYYLVVPTQAGREGSYGSLAEGAERPPAASACYPQVVSACVP